MQLNEYMAWCVLDYTFVLMARVWFCLLRDLFNFGFSTVEGVMTQFFHHFLLLNCCNTFLSTAYCSSIWPSFGVKENYIYVVCSFLISNWVGCAHVNTGLEILWCFQLCGGHSKGTQISTNIKENFVEIQNKCAVEDVEISQAPVWETVVICLHL